MNERYRRPAGLSDLQRIVVPFLLALFLSACALGPKPHTEATAAPPSGTLEFFSLEGRFSLRNDEKNYAGRLSWTHLAGGDEFLLSSPFGQGMAKVTTDAAGAHLATNDGKTYSATDVEALTLQVLGYPLPLGLLADWVRGRSARGAFGLPDASGRPLALQQEGWRIAYEYDTEDSRALPARLFVERDDGLQLRLRIDEWRAIDGAAALP